ncbi:MAG TPA: hypothetical protein VEG84_07800 [Thermoanaerobaculia bacterium]|nr:hypothetical protein [Thermoanaerobaculia bacterium]
MLRKAVRQAVEESFGCLPPHEQENGQPDQDDEDNGRCIGPQAQGRERSPAGRRTGQTEGHGEQKVENYGAAVERALEEDRSEERGEGEPAHSGEHRRPDDLANARREVVGGEADGRRQEGRKDRDAADRAQQPCPADRPDEEGQDGDRKAGEQPLPGCRLDGLL